MEIQPGDTRKRIFGFVGVLAFWRRNPRPNRVREVRENARYAKAKANECSNGKTSMGEKQDRKCMMEEVWRWRCVMKNSGRPPSSPGS
jgi:hypothetical protein